MKTIIVVLVLSMAGALGQNAPLGQQKICAERAQQLIDADTENRKNAAQDVYLFSTYSDTNHFNAQDSICYATTRLTMISRKSFEPVFAQTLIVNAFDGDTVAWFTQGTGEDTHFCLVEAQKCKSEGEFSRLVAQMLYRRKK